MTAGPPMAGAPCVAVVGMHRSGTSATAGLLIGLGLSGPRPADLVPADDSNQLGHWESQAVHLCNVHVLAARGATTYAPPPVGLGWEDDAALEPFRAEARRWLSDTSAGRPLMVKDPRLCLTMPFWRTVVTAPLGAVLVLRDPVEVARSLRARDGIPVLLGLALWDRYLRSAALGLAGLPTLVVTYDALVSDPAGWVETVCRFLGHLEVAVDPGARGAAAKLLDARLRHQATGAGPYDAIARDQRQLLGVLAAQAGPHSAWRPPDLAPPPAWVDDVIELRRELSGTRRQLYWTQQSRTFRAVSALWRWTGRGPQPLAAPTGPADPGVAR